MMSRTEIISVQLPDDTIVKVSASVLDGEMDVADWDRILPFKQVTDTIESIADAIVATLEKVKPKKASVEFGIEVALESGALTALLVKGTGTGNLKITLEWERKATPG